MTEDGQHVLRYIRTIEGMLNKLEIECDNLRANWDYSISERASAYERIDQLEQLCRDMHYVIFDRTYEEVSTPEHNEFMKRMDALGLLEEE